MLYCKKGRDWEAVLDVSKIEYPPLPDHYNIENEAHTEIETWMRSEACREPISGIVLNRDGNGVGIAMGGTAVAWFDLEKKECSGWLVIGEGTYFSQMLREGPGERVWPGLSPDEKRLLYRSGAQNESMVFTFDLPSMNSDAVFAVFDDGDQYGIGSLEIGKYGAVSSNLVVQPEERPLCIDPQEEWFVTLEDRGLSAYELLTGNASYKTFAENRSPTTCCTFDEQRKYALYGGGWNKEVLIFSLPDWKEILYSSEYFTDLQIDYAGGKTTLLCTRCDKTLLSFDIAPDNTVTENWTRETASSPMAVIPFTDPECGVPRVWCKLWFQDFDLYDLDSGKTVKHFTHWVRSGIKNPVFISGDPRVFFPKENEGLEIVLKSDLYPLFDSRFIDFEIENAVLNSDATRIYFLGADHILRCMKLPDL